MQKDRKDAGAEFMNISKGFWTLKFLPTKKILESNRSIDSNEMFITYIYSSQPE
jgi:hypothetical protein